MRKVTQFYATILSKVYCHIVFSTKFRAKSIDKEIQLRLYEYIGGICKGLDCNPIKVGGYYDHVHILCTLSRKITIAKLLEEVKKNSSKWIKLQSSKYESFYWQNGYAIFSVNPSQIEIVERYIANQENHHAKIDFKEESRLFFKKYDVEYDEKYVWD